MSSNATLVRRAAPAFSADAVVGTDFAPVSLGSLLADGHWAVLAFYPADWTFVCPTELQSFSDASATFLAHKCRVAVVSVDNKHSCVRGARARVRVRVRARSLAPPRAPLPNAPARAPPAGTWPGSSTRARRAAWAR